MNKKIFSYLTVAAATAILSSCSEEQTLPVGEGTMFVSTIVNADLTVESRADAEEELAASAKVWIYSEEGIVRKFNTLSEIPSTGLQLISGQYTVKAWAGTAEYASFESRWFEGQQPVTIEANKSVSVEVVCKIANVVASVKYPENIDDLIQDYTMTVSHKGGSLTFEGQDTRKGYYMMPEGVTTLDYTLAFTTDGEQKTVHGTIADVQPAHEYVLNVLATAQDDDTTGGAFLQIVVDETTIDCEDEIVLTTPPAITGYGFDIASPVAGESGSIGRKSIYVCAASPLVSLAISNVPQFAYPEFDLMAATATVIAELESYGISHEVTNLADGSQMVKVIFEDTYLNSLPNSDDPYVINISARDSGNKSTSATLTLRISEAPVTTGAVETASTTYTSTRVAAIAVKDVDALGVEYAVTGTDDWTYVEAEAASRAAFVKGQTYYVTLNNLQPATTYKYRAVSNYGTDNAYTAEEAELTTNNGPQLPNYSFENWYQNSKVWMPMGESEGEGWDSGNHGSATMNKNITNYSTAYTHSGSYCAELKSQFVGIGSIGKFAAGNIFYGKYLATDGTDGVIGFGREFSFPEDIKPVAIKLWAKYIPTNTWKGDSDYKPASGYDEGHIFTALFDDFDYGDSSYSGQYGYVVRTKNSSRLFDKTASNIIAYGEKVFTEATAGSGLIEITIPYEYYSGKENTQPKLIAVVCTASKYGDYFQGGEGTLLYVDDIQIVYSAR